MRRLVVVPVREIKRHHYPPFPPGRPLKMLPRLENLWVASLLLGALQRQPLTDGRKR
jgi:hypothetical protein